jgi:hypothetical protein
LEIVRSGLVHAPIAILLDEPSEEAGEIAGRVPDAALTAMTPLRMQKVGPEGRGILECDISKGLESVKGLKSPDLCKVGVGSLGVVPPTVELIKHDDDLVVGVPCDN